MGRLLGAISHLGSHPHRLPSSALAAELTGLAPTVRASRVTRCRATPSQEPVRPGPHIEAFSDLVPSWK